jgi:hypothetical protein
MQKRNEAGRGRKADDLLDAMVKGWSAPPTDRTRLQWEQV